MKCPLTSFGGVTLKALTIDSHQRCLRCLIIASMCLGLFQSASSQNSTPAVEIYQCDSNTVYCYDKFGTTIVSVGSTFDFLLISKDPESVQSEAKKAQYRIVINGSFYDGTNLEATHAGWLRLFGDERSPVKEEAQLSHIVCFEPQSQSITFTDYRQFVASNSQSTIEFQTGPLVIGSNNVAYQYIRESINGVGEYKRSLLATVNKREIYFIITRESASLIDLGQFLLSLPIFADKRLDIVNLDGGPSVALYVKGVPKACFNENARLPILLGVK